MLFGYEPGGPAKIPGSAVIAKAGPKRQHFLFLRFRQRFYVRKPLQEAIVVWNYGFYLSLLKHYL
jgi:hypothetical protein